MKITQNINKTSLMIACLSFLLGTALFIIHLVEPSYRLLEIGLFYTLIALVLNSITLIELIGHAIINPHHSNENLITIGVLLLNIPVTLTYLMFI
ncbi:hypothetical protein GCM10022393_03920 [Aquimarina addita]|uniref:Uncharacterized protein n=1 Tax=Aquimarina addita TaxID=870485 RepID=A0ABP7XAH3_9FLAO